MAGKSSTPEEKVERLLDKHNATIGVVRKHAERLTDAVQRLGKTDSDMEMYAQHRSVSDDLRERVSVALAGSSQLDTWLNDLPQTFDESRWSGAPGPDDETDEDGYDSHEDNDADPGEDGPHVDESAPRPVAV